MVAFTSHKAFVCWRSLQKLQVVDAHDSRYHNVFFSHTDTHAAAASIVFIGGILRFYQLIMSNFTPSLTGHSSRMTVEVCF